MKSNGENMIDKIKILCTDYEVKSVKNEDFKQQPGIVSNGDINFKTNTIRINKDLGKDFQAITLIHEALHSFWFQTGRFVDMDDEELITNTSHALYHILKENPLLLKYIAETLAI